LQQHAALDNGPDLRKKLIHTVTAAARYEQAATEMSIQLPACSDQSWVSSSIGDAHPSVRRKALRHPLTNVSRSVAAMALLN